MQEDDFDKDNLSLQTVKPKPEKGESHRLDDAEDCYWCGRAIDINLMTKRRMHDSIVYVCQDCG